MNQTPEKDPKDILPWSPQIIERESLANSPNSHRETYYPRKIRFSPKIQFSQVLGSEMTTAQETQQEDDEPQTPQFDPNNLPWSPLPRAPLEIAYIFGNCRHPLVEKIIPLLKQKYNINLIFSVSKQPPKPFPLFFLYSAEDNIAKVLRVGNECSDGHCILIFPDNKKLPENSETLECIKLQIPVGKQGYDPQDLDKLCVQMSDCTKSVYTKNASQEKGFY